MTLFSIEPSPMVIVGPFPVNYNDPNVLTTGVPLWTPEAGYVIYNMWFTSATPFTGTGTTYVEVVLQTANDVLYPAGGYYLPILVHAGGIYNEDSGTDVARNATWDVLAGQTSGGYRQGWFPARMKNSVPILLKLVPDTGTLTAGVLNVYAMVGELA